MIPTDQDEVTVAWLNQLDEKYPGYSPELSAAVIARLSRALRAVMGENEQLARERDENYSDLLDQMDECWGKGHYEVDSAEVRAFLESRIVHKPTTRLRQRVAQLEAELGCMLGDLNTAEQRVAELEAELTKLVDECGYWRAYAEDAAGHELDDYTENEATASGRKLNDCASPEDTALWYVLNQGKK